MSRRGVFKSAELFFFSGKMARGENRLDKNGYEVLFSNDTKLYIITDFQMSNAPLSRRLLHSQESQY